MIAIICAERLKLKHSFGGKIHLIAPTVNLLLTLLLTDGKQNDFAAGAWNWWYTMLLPGMLSVVCFLVVRKDSKLKYCAIRSLNIPLEKSWIGKIIYCSIALLASNFIIFFGTILAKGTISVWGGFSGAILLSISCLWEIPLFLFLSARLGIFGSIFTAMFLSVSGVVTLADSTYWWAFAPSIPIRLMCPVLLLLPNGLPIPVGSELLNANVILPGILLSLLWFFALAAITAFWFGRWEAK